MKKLVLAILILAVVSGGAAADDEQGPDPLEILKKADAAIKDIDAVAYTARSTPTGTTRSGPPCTRSASWPSATTWRSSA